MIEALIKMIPKINRSLLLLKFALFLWFGGAAVINTFIFLYLKQKGFSLAHISLIGIICPVFQCIGPTICGIIADKTGKSKPVVFANFLLVIVFVNSILLIPSIEKNNPLDSTHEFNNFSIIPITNYTSLNNNCTLNYKDYDSSSWCVIRTNSTCNISIEEISFCDESTVILDSSNDPCCGNSTTEEYHSNPNEVLVVSLSVLLLICFFTTMCNVYAFMDVTLIFMVERHGCDFGRERMWTLIGLLTLSPLAGYLIEVNTPPNGVVNYNLAFYMFDVLAIITMFMFWKLEIQINPPAKDMCQKILSLMKDLDFLVFMVCVLVLGTMFGFKENYSSLYLEELDAPSMLISLIRSVTGIVGLPFLAISDWWMTKVGSINLVLSALASYVVGFLGYSFLVDPWWCLLCECMTIFTYHLMWVAVIRRSHEIAPEGLVATAISTTGSLHYALGTTTGSLIGGLIMTNYGGRRAYRVMAVICATTCLLYGLFTCFRRRKKRVTPQLRKSYEMDIRIGNFSDRTTDDV